VTAPSGTATSAAAFSVTAATPAISSFAPANGVVGTSGDDHGNGVNGRDQREVQRDDRDIQRDEQHSHCCDCAKWRDERNDFRDDAEWNRDFGCGIYGFRARRAGFDDFRDFT